MPVLPLVGSTSTVSGLMRPCFSSASIMLTPIRSLTLAQGLKNSSFRRMRPGRSRPILLSRTRGVRPMVCRMLSKIFAMVPALRREKGRVPVPPRDREPCPTWKPGPTGASARRVALHFKASAAPRNMRDDRLAAVDLRDGAQVDREGELDDGALG